MNNHEIDFLKNKTYIGIFYLPDDKEVMVQLIYQKNYHWTDIAGIWFFWINRAVFQIYLDFLVGNR